MRILTKLLVCLMALSLPLSAGTELPLNIKKLSDRVLVVWVADYYQTIGVVALATEKGIVTIDANLSRSNDMRIRKAIAEEFGRSDFKYLINTHYHHDHTGGNQAYADIEIIAHKNCPAGMKKELTDKGLDDLIGRFKERLKIRRLEIKQLDPESREQKTMNEEIILLRQAVDEFENGFVPTYPTLLFEKNMILDMGDMTLELYYFGGRHTNSDIVIYIPEEGLVALGDHIPGIMLPFVGRGTIGDLPVVLEHWSRIIESGREIKHVTMAHWDMPMSVEAFKEQYFYLKTVVDTLDEMQQAGNTLDDAKRTFTIEKDFPFFKDKILKIRDIDLHENNIEALWKWLSGK